MSSPNPGAGGFQLDEKYEQQLADICTEFSNAIVAFSSACAAGTTILSNFSTLSDHDFSSETSAINNINTTTDEMVSAAATMALDFEALESALHQIDDYILNKLTDFDGLSSKEKAELISEYNKYKNGEITYEDFLQHLADLNSTDLISDMFGEYAGSYLAESLKHGGKITVKLLEESIIESSILSVAERWGLDFFTNGVTYGFSSGLSYGIADKLYEIILQKAKDNQNLADLIEKFMGNVNLEKNIFAGFWVNAILISTTNILIDLGTGNLDLEAGVRDIGDGVSCAASWAVGEYIIGLIEAGAISLGTGAVGGALIVAGVYVGCSKLVDIIADSIFNDANMNYDHDKLIEELKENGYILYDTLKVLDSDESVVDAYLRMKEEGAPRSLTNFLLGSSGLPYDTNYDDSVEFAAITYLCDGGTAIFPGDYSDADIQSYASMMYPNSEEQEAFINAAKEVRDYFNNNRTEDNAIINEYLGLGTMGYIRNEGTFSVN